MNVFTTYCRRTGARPASSPTVAPEPTSANALQGSRLILFLGVGCSGLAYHLRGHAQRLLSEWRIASWCKLTPVICSVADMIPLGEAVGMRQLGGGGLILLNVLLTSLPEPARSGSEAASSGSFKPDAECLLANHLQAAADDVPRLTESAAPEHPSPAERKRWRRQRPYGVPEPWDLPLQRERTERRPQDALSNAERETRAATLHA